MRGREDRNFGMKEYSNQSYAWGKGFFLRRGTLRAWRSEPRHDHDLWWNERKRET